MDERQDKIDGDVGIKVQGGFYEKLSNACLSWAQDQYGEKLKKEYSALESTKERARFRTQKYRLRIGRCFENEQYVAFLCESALADQWSGVGEGYRRASQVWNKEEETQLPPSQILRAFGLRLGKKELPFSPDGIYPEGCSLVIFRNATQSLPFAEKKFSIKKID